jgi:hypothetical protein
MMSFQRKGGLNMHAELYFENPSEACPLKISMRLNPSLFLECFVSQPGILFYLIQQELTYDGELKRIHQQGYGYGGGYDVRPTCSYLVTQTFTIMYTGSPERKLSRGGGFCSRDPMF